MPHYRSNPVVGGLFIIGGVVLLFLSYLAFDEGLVYFAWLPVVGTGSFLIGILGEKDNLGYLLLSIGLFSEAFYSLLMGEVISSLVVFFIGFGIFYAYLKGVLGKEETYAFSNSVKEWILYDLYLK